MLNHLDLLDKGKIANCYIDKCKARLVVKIFATASTFAHVALMKAIRLV